MIPGSQLGDNTAPQYSWINTQRTALTDEHSAGADLAGWPEGEVGGGVESMWKCVWKCVEERAAEERIALGLCFCLHANGVMRS